MTNGASLPPIVMALTGASGAPYGVRLLQQLAASGRDVSLIVSTHGLRLLRTETDVGDIARPAGGGGCIGVGRPRDRP